MDEIYSVFFLNKLNCIYLVCFFVFYYVTIGYFVVK
jgi:hypothetical protein